MHTLDPLETTRLVRASLATLPAHYRGCVMCALAGGHDEKLLVKRLAGATVVLDRFAARRAHLLVVIDRHAEKVGELDWPAWEKLQRAAWEASRALEAVLKPKRIYVAALGASKALEKSWPHLHLHVVPLDDDGESARPARVFSWSEALYGYEDGEAEALAEQLRAAWPH
ncbi:MAG: HIT family protein [Myxococcaceae bacterium]